MSRAVGPRSVGLMRQDSPIENAGVQPDGPWLLIERNQVKFPSLDAETAPTSSANIPRDPGGSFKESFLFFC